MRFGDYHWIGQSKQITLNNLWKHWVPDRELKLSSTPKTEIVCRLCRGTKLAYTDNGTQTKLVTCPQCLGTGTMRGFDHEQYKPRNN